MLRNRRKFCIPNTENFDGQMGGQVNAPDEKGGSNQNISDNCDDAKRQIENRNGGDRAFHQRDHGNQGEGGSPQDCPHTCKYFSNHQISPQHFILHGPFGGTNLV